MHKFEYTYKIDKLSHLTLRLLLSHLLKYPQANFAVVLDMDGSKTVYADDKTQNYIENILK